ncbi:putative acetylornithine aminotransferase [Mollisia scopiformis]|uniref:Putative acetylornithine aminotransferase n=1 Tax=Mollisia scopiformis TaxID=149040 RepID=A0A194X0V1_MOLSC|nr:putative acetylornithine aminotransferase [Mollisia scopiformis]KUJ13594.1 putative acetylornithine aminotransferase [Mollisia scopiformis]
MHHKRAPTFGALFRADSSKLLPTSASSDDPLLAALTTVQEQYITANDQSHKAHEEACHDFPGGNTRTVLHASPFPLTFIKAKGCELTSLDGTTYVDFLGEYTAGIYGHSNEKIAAAVSECMSRGWNYGGPNIYERQLARKVTERFSPSGIELVRFTNSGTESNTMAIAASLVVTGRKTVLAFKNGYHGGTLSFPITLKDINVNLPHDFVLAPYNDIEGTKAVIASLPKDSVAAIIVECVQGSGGCIVGNVDFLSFLNKAANELNAVFIVDEVMTSRLSYHGYSSELGLRPDLVTLGKWIGGGMTFGAFGGRKDDGIMSLFDPQVGMLGHSGTFNNNIVSMAAGCVGMDIYNEEQVKRLNALGESLKLKIEVVLETHGVHPPATMKAGTSPLNQEAESPFTGLESEPSLANGVVAELQQHESGGRAKNHMWITGKGSMLCVHFSGECEMSLKALYWHHMLDHGIYMAQRGFMALNIELNEEHIERYAKAVEEFVVKWKPALK